MECMSDSIPGKVMWIISFIKVVERAVGVYRNIFGSYTTVHNIGPEAS